MGYKRSQLMECGAYAYFIGIFYFIHFLLDNVKHSQNTALIIKKQQVITVIIETYRNLDYIYRHFIEMQYS